MTEPSPLYQRLKAHILDYIATGQLNPGDQVPSENALVKEFGVSRMTANRALRELMAAGVVTRVAGLGTFVAARAAQTGMIELRDIADEIARRGNRHTMECLLRETLVAGADLGRALACAEGTLLFHIRMVHSENGTPVQLEDRHVNPVLAPDFLAQSFEQETPAAWLARTVAASHVEHTVGALLPDAQTRRLLVMTDEPCLVLYRRTFADRAIVSTASLTCPADRYALYGRHAFHTDTMA